jgi:hypothetical protein
VDGGPIRAGLGGPSPGASICRGTRGAEHPDRGVLGAGVLPPGVSEGGGAPLGAEPPSPGTLSLMVS